MPNNNSNVCQKVRVIILGDLIFLYRIMNIFSKFKHYEMLAIHVLISILTATVIKIENATSK